MKALNTLKTTQNADRLQDSFYEINRFRFILNGVPDDEYGPLSPEEYINLRKGVLEEALAEAAHYIHRTVEFKSLIPLELSEDQKRSILSRL